MQWTQDKELQSLLAEINEDDGSGQLYFGEYSSKKVQTLKDHSCDRVVIGKRGLKYERLDQPTVEFLLGVR